jgi:hypothetical protein
MSGLFEGIFAGGTAAYGANRYGDQLSELGQASEDNLAAVGDQARQDTGFRGFETVSSTGNTVTNPDGSTTNTLSGANQAVSDQALQSANGLFQEAGVSVADRTNDIFGAASQALQGQFAMQNTQLGNDLYSSGRTGFNSASFGGSSEQYANRQSQEQSMLNAFYGARTQAGQEQLQQAQAAGSLLDSSFTPGAQLTMQQQAGQNNANMAQTGQIAGANLGTQADITGVQANINAQIEQAKIQAGMFGSAASVAGSVGSALDSTGAASAVGDFIKDLF